MNQDSVSYHKDREIEAEMDAHIQKYATGFKLFEPYTATDGNIFFGREEEKSQLYETVHKGSFISIVGKSGVGKSSLVNCGLADYAKKHYISWKFITIRRKNHFVRSFLEILHKQIGHLEKRELYHPEDLSKSKIQITTQFEKIKADISPLVLEALNLIEVIARCYQCQLIFVFDQFEELFSSEEDDEMRKIERNEIIELFRSFDEYLDPEIYKVLILQRSDYIEHFEYHFRKFPKILQQQFWVRPMDKRGIKEFLYRSFIRLNINNPQNGEEKAMRNSPEIKLIVEKLAFKERVVGQFELPYINVYLQKLYFQDYIDTLKTEYIDRSIDIPNERIPIQIEKHEIEGFGDIRKIIRQYFYEEIGWLQKKYHLNEKNIFSFFDRLVTLDGLKKSYQIEQGELEQIFGSDVPVDEVLLSLQKKKMINRIDADKIELSHDCIAEIIFQDQTHKSDYLVQLNLRSEYEVFKKQNKAPSFLNLFGWGNPNYASRSLLRNADVFSESLPTDLLEFADESKTFYKARNRIRLIGIIILIFILSGIIQGSIARMQLQHKRDAMEQEAERNKREAHLKGQFYLIGRAYKSREGDRTFAYRMADTISQRFQRSDIILSQDNSGQFNQDSIDYLLAKELKRDLEQELLLKPFYRFFKSSLPCREMVDIKSDSVNNKLMIAIGDGSQIFVYQYDIRSNSFDDGFPKQFTSSSDSIMDIRFGDFPDELLVMRYKEESSPKMIRWNYMENLARDYATGWKSIELSNAINEVRMSSGTLAAKIWKRINDKHSVQIGDNLLFYRDSVGPVKQIAIIPILTLDTLKSYAEKIVDTVTNYPSIQMEGRIPDILDIKLPHKSAEYFYLLSSNNRFHLVSYDSISNQIILQYTFPVENNPTEMQFSKSDENFLALKSDNGVVRIYKDEIKSLVLNKVLHTELRETKLAFSQNDRFAVTIGAHKNGNLGNSLQIWDLTFFDDPMNQSETSIKKNIPGLVERLGSKISNIPRPINLHAEKLYKSALLNWENRDDISSYGKSISELNKAIEIDPFFAQAHGLLALVLMNGIERGNYPDSKVIEEKTIELRKHANLALKIDGQQIHAILALGAHYQHVNQYEQAKREYIKAHSLSRQNGTALQALAEINLYQGNYVDALRYVNDANEVEPFTEAIMQYQSLIQMANGNLKMYVELSKELVSRFPDQRNKNYYRWAHSMIEGQYDIALENIPSDLTTRMNQVLEGLILLDKNEEREYDQFSNNPELYPAVKHNLDLFYMISKNEMNQARTEFRKMMEEGRFQMVWIIQTFPFKTFERFRNDEEIQEIAREFDIIFAEHPYMLK